MEQNVKKTIPKNYTKFAQQDRRFKHKNRDRSLRSRRVSIPTSKVLTKCKEQQINIFIIIYRYDAKDDD
jgi:hypothetical protein